MTAPSPQDPYGGKYGQPYPIPGAPGYGRHPAPDYDNPVFQAGGEPGYPPQYSQYPPAGSVGAPKQGSVQTQYGVGYPGGGGGGVGYPTGGGYPGGPGAPADGAGYPGVAEPKDTDDPESQNPEEDPFTGFTEKSVRLGKL